MAANSVILSQQVQAFHQFWPDWRGNFKERYYEEEFNLVVMGAKAAQEALMGSNILKCINVLNRIDGSANCDQIMLKEQRECESHLYILNTCNNIRYNQLQQYLNARGLN